MLIRLIMTVFLLVVSAMPALANDKETELPPEIKSLIEAGIELYEEEVLQNLQIDVKDRLEGDTYHISYTITNPTNTPLKKKVALTTVTYDLCHIDDPYQSITQCTDTVSELAIEPYATQTINIALKQPMPVQFNHLTSCTFFFEDKSYLQYNTLSESAPASAFHLTPIVSPFGEVSLKIQNYSPTKTITELRDIRLNFTIGDESRKMLMTKPIALQIKPNESYTLPLFTLKSADTKKSASPFSLSAKTDKATRNYNYHINMKINGIPHTYIDNRADATQVSGAAKRTQIDKSDIHYQFAPNKSDSQDNAFYLDGSNLYGYVKVNKTFTSTDPSQITYRLTLPYFDRNSHYQEKQFSFRLSPNDSLADKAAYYTFKLPLPADFAKPHAIGSISFHAVTNRTVEYAKLTHISDASAAPKKDYTILTNVTDEQ